MNISVQNRRTIYSTSNSTDLGNFIPLTAMFYSDDDDDDDDDDGLYFKTISIKAAKACGVVYNN